MGYYVPRQPRVKCNTVVPHVTYERVRNGNMATYIRVMACPTVTLVTHAIYPRAQNGTIATLLALCYSIAGRPGSLVISFKC